MSTGEVRLDDQSLRGKVVGRVAELATASRTDLALCVGAADPTVADRVGEVAELVWLAGFVADALARPEHWLRLLGRDLAASRAHPTPSRAR